MTGFICGPGIYEYKGITIELGGIGGPWPINKKGNPYERIPKKVDEIVREWCTLDKEEQNKYRIGGGCQLI